MNREELLELSQNLLIDLANNRSEVPADLYDRLLGGILTLATEMLASNSSTPNPSLRIEVLERLSSLKLGVGISRHTLISPLRPRYSTSEVNDLLERLESEGVIERRLIRNSGPGRPTTMYFFIKKVVDFNA